MLKTYRELRRLDTFEERFRYLVLGGAVGRDTFGFDRYLNQQFYRSREWKSLRQEVIVRDNGCDLGVPEYEIYTRLYIHHMNPLTPDAIKHGFGEILDPDFLITTSHRTHNAIHYGDESQLPRSLIERTRNDTKLW